MALVLAPCAICAGLLSVEPGATEISIKVSPVKPAAIGVLDLLDAKSGCCFRTLHAGSFSSSQTIVLKKSNVTPGGYRLRYREGLTLAVDGSLALPGKEKWQNPTDVFVAEKAVYVLDSGKTPPKKEGAKNGTAENDLPPEETDRGKPFIYKFQRDGKSDTSFGDRGRIGPVFQSATSLRCIAVDRAGMIYIGSGSHEIMLLDSQGNRVGQTIGGWDSDPHGPKCTVWVNSFAFGPSNRIYIPNGYGHMKVYNRTKDKFDGVLHTTPLPNYIGMDRCVAADGDGAVYIINRSNQLHKFNDLGTSAKPGYISDPEAKLVCPTGPCAVAGLVWVACHGGPPLWDSDAGEVVLFWDDGSALTLVERFGQPGKSADRLEFLNPSSIGQTPDGLELWVAEDGLTNDEGPPGNARIRRFRITASQTEEAPLEIEAGK